jgi:hypothetical protein
MRQQGCKGGQYLGGVIKAPKIGTQSEGAYVIQGKGQMKRARNLLRAKRLYYLPTN